MENYDTLSQATTALKEQGYKIDFDFKKGKLEDVNSKKEYDPNKFRIVKLFRFEGMTNPSDMSVVYAISTTDGDKDKGLLIDAYGTYSDDDSAEALKKMIREHGNKQES